MRRMGRVGAIAVVTMLVLLLFAVAWAGAFPSRPSGTPAASTGTLVTAISVTKNITVGKHPDGVTYSPATHEIYVANYGSNTVSVINASTDKVVSNITVGKEPVGLAYDPSNKDLYVFNDGSSSYSVISTANKVTKTVSIHGVISSTVYDPKNGDIYALSFAVVPPATLEYNLTKINKTTQNITVIHVGLGADWAAYDNASTDLVVSNLEADSLSVVNSTTNAVTTLLLSKVTGPGESIYSPTTKDLYVLDSGVGTKTSPTGNVTVLSPANKIVATLKVGPEPLFASLDPVNHAVYVSNYGIENATTKKYSNSTVSVINTTNKVATTIKVGKQPAELGYSPKDGDLYIPCYGSNETFVVNASTNKLVKTLTTKQFPSVAVYDSGNGDILVVGNSNETGTPVKSDIYAISSTNAVTTLVLGLGPVGGGAFDPLTLTAFLSNSGSATVSVIH
ncbi:MAG TPA: hypothetical protein VEH57_06245 [Thermoplasmata archaeon]|nr:hypothetical protein [Thermoplasmata archaeon]